MASNITSIKSTEQATGGLYRAVGKESARLVSYILEWGTPSLYIDLDELQLVVHPELRGLMDAALTSPGFGIDNFFNARTFDSEDELKWAKEVMVASVPVEDAIVGVIAELRNLYRRRSMHQKLVSALEDIESGSKSREREALKKVISLTTQTEEVYDDGETIEIPGSLPEGLEPIDRSKFPITGTVFDAWTILGPGEMGMLLAGPGVGKTTGLVDIGAGYIRNNPGLVIHFSEEIRGLSIHGKYARRLTGDPDSGHGRDDLAKIKLPGRLVIESHPTGTSTFDFFRSRINKFMQDTNLPMTAIILDYLALCKGCNESMFESLAELVIRARAMAIEYMVPLWSACQPQRNPMKEVQGGMPSFATKIKSLGSNSQPVLGMADVSQCWAIPHVVDYLISLNQTRDEKEKTPEEVRIHRAKVREPKHKPEHNVTIKSQVDYAISTFV